MFKVVHLRLFVTSLIFINWALSVGAYGQGAAETSSRDLSYTISTSQAWTDTGVDLQSGDSLEITVASPSGNAVPDRHAIGLSTCDPNGDSGAVKGPNLPVPSAAPGALIVKLQAQGSPIAIGSEKQIKAEASGHLFLGVNIDGTPPCMGSLAVKIHLISGAAPSTASAVPAATAAPGTARNAATTTAGVPAQGAQTNDAAPDIKKILAAAAQVWMQGQFGTEKTGADKNGAAPASSSAVSGSASPASTTALDLSKDRLDSGLAKDIDGLPRRVNDQFNNMGDMVNFVMVGSLQQVQSSLDAANWHSADTDNTESALKAVLETYQKKDYLTMPMSPLRLFGRVQDYGYEQAEPYSVVASRHHFRIWKAPFTYKGEAVWVGAGTHDIGFEKDQRNGKVTHKIDPAVDGERDNIGSSLQKAGKVKSMHYYMPPNPVQDARNATGGGYHSDGRIIVMLLK
jgi:hypothetical protein